MTLAASVAAVAVLGVLVFDAVVLREDDAALTGAIEDALELLRASGPPEAAFEATRAMYRRFGIDPTRRRPSSEALLRRIRKGDRLPRINTLVDVCNWCSVEVQLPYGLYDLDRIDGDVELRMGLDGEPIPASARTSSTSRGGRWSPTGAARSAIPPPTRHAQWSRPPRRARWSSSSRPATRDGGCLRCST